MLSLYHDIYMFNTDVDYNFGIVVCVISEQILYYKLQLQCFTLNMIKLIKLYFLAAMFL